MLTLRTVAVSVLVALAWGTAVGTVLVIQPELPIRLDLGLFVQSVAIGLVSSGMYAVPPGSSAGSSPPGCCARGRAGGIASGGSGSERSTVPRSERSARSRSSCSSTR